MMAPDERLRLEAEAFARQADYRREFIVLQTVFLAVLPLGYAVLIFVYGERLWTVAGGSIDVYSTALGLPNAPESWGAMFFVLGLGCLVALFSRHDRWLSAVSGLTALIVASFMVAFISDFFRFHAPQALPAALVYGVISLSFFNLSRLAWVSGKNRAPTVKP